MALNLDIGHGSESMMSSLSGGTVTNEIQRTRTTETSKTTAADVIGHEAAPRIHG